MNQAPCLMIAFIIALLWPIPSAAEEVRVATASNFREAMSSLAIEFEMKSGHSVVPVFGSTGKHYTQIVNGAAFDAFFAADSRRPELLEQQDIAVPGTRFTYATGQLVLWSLAEGYVDGNGDILEHGDFRHLAIANPDLAPYGTAARDVLVSLGLWRQLNKRVVLGENIGQAFLFVHTGNAELGFVANSQLMGTDRPDEGSAWTVPEHLHRPIDQQAVLLNDKPAPRAFLSFIRSQEAARIIRNHGYSIPDHVDP